jgi:hypothetical protein
MNAGKMSGRKKGIQGIGDNDVMQGGSGLLYGEGEREEVGSDRIHVIFLSKNFPLLRRQYFLPLCRTKRTHISSFYCPRNLV